MKCRISRTTSTILLLFCAATPGMAAERPQKTRRKQQQQQQRKQHRLQEMDVDIDEEYELFLEIPTADTSETIETVDTDTFVPPARFDEDQVDNLDLTSSSTGSQEATISGMVYSDIDQNGSREVELDPPVVGAVVRLYSCSSGARLGTTRTNEDGEYSFTISPNYLPPSNVNAKACFYIQYDVNDNILPDAIFTTPTNGETPDILLVRGQTVTGMDAGAYGQTPDPTLEWTTWSPTMDGTLAPITSMPTPAPVIIVPETPKPSPSPVVMSVDLPLPTDTVALPTTTGGGQTGTGDNVILPVQSQTGNGDNVIPVQSPDTSTSATTATVPGTVLTFKPPDTVPETPPSTSTGGTAIGGVIWEKDPIVIEDGDISKQELSGNETNNATQSNNTVGTSSGTINLESRVMVKLSDLQSEMNADAQTLFEKVCTEFLTEQLVIATPPIYNLDCEVVGQSFDEGRRRRLRTDATMSLESSPQPGHHRALKSSLTAEVEVTGQTNKTQSVQEPSDVKFQELLVGTFNVQGYLFAGALKAESLSNTSTSETSEYFGDVGNVRGIAAVDDAEAQDTNGTDATGQEEGLSKGAMTAIAVGGVFSIGLLCLMGMKARRRKQAGTAPMGSLSAGRAKKAKSASSGASNNKGSIKRKLSLSRRNMKSPSPTNASLQTAPSSPTMAAYIATAPPDSPEGDVEVGLDPAMAVPPSPQTQRTRVQKTITAPSGKLGLMVANTKGYGPAVHTIRPGSPMENLIFRGDIITSVNGADTRNHTAEQITQIMKDTVGEERKITVLSTHQ